MTPSTKTTRLLADLECDDVDSALRHMVRMRTALRVIRTWASVDNALQPSEVVVLIDKVLKND